MPKRLETGIVTNDKTAKTRRVEIPRLVKHPRYGKYIRQKTICYVHDEATSRTTATWSKSSNRGPCRE
jgi:small subunit ribosomal protein S17